MLESQLPIRICMIIVYKYPVNFCLILPITASAQTREVVGSCHTISKNWRDCSDHTLSQTTDSEHASTFQRASGHPLCAFASPPSEKLAAILTTGKFSIAHRCDRVLYGTERADDCRRFVVTISCAGFHAQHAIAAGTRNDRLCGTNGRWVINDTAQQRLEALAGKPKVSETVTFNCSDGQLTEVLSLTETIIFTRNKIAKLLVINKTLNLVN